MTDRKEYLRKYQREWWRKRRQDFFSDKKCLICSSIENLELHHREPALKVSHNIWSWSTVRRNTEIAKCDILCHDCHLKETIKQNKSKVSKFRLSSAKLTAEQVEYVRNSVKKGSDIARELDVSKFVISRVRRGITWRVEN